MSKGRTFLLRLTEEGEPIDPAIWFGPLPNIWPVDWIGYECNETEPPYVPELESPDAARMRRVGRLCVGMRPSRSSPRGISFTIPTDGATGGSSPPGMLGTLFRAVDPDSIDSALGSARYGGDNGEGATIDWLLSADVSHHATSNEPLAYVADDFVLSSSVTFTDTNGDPWGLFSGSYDWAGTPLLTETQIPSLQIARESLGKPTNKNRSIVFNPLKEPIACPGFPDWSIPHTWPQDENFSSYIRGTPDGGFRVDSEIDFFPSDNPIGIGNGLSIGVSDFNLGLWRMGIEIWYTGIAFHGFWRTPFGFTFPIGPGTEPQDVDGLIVGCAINQELQRYECWTDGILRAFVERPIVTTQGCSLVGTGSQDWNQWKESKMVLL